MPCFNLDIISNDLLLTDSINVGMVIIFLIVILILLKFRMNEKVYI
jgi:hypothetical protein